MGNCIITLGQYQPNFLRVRCIQLRQQVAPGAIAGPRRNDDGDIGLHDQQQLAAASGTAVVEAVEFAGAPPNKP